MTITATDLTTLTGDYTLDTAHSRVGFLARHAMVTKVRGLFTEFDGHIHIDGSDPARSNAEVTIQVASVDSQQPDRDKHLRSADFFDVENHPTITFKSTKAELLDEGTYRLTGDLTIRGVTHPVAIDLEFTGATNDPWGLFRVGFEGAVVVNRRDWGLGWNMPLDTGGLLVSEKITIELDIAAVRPVAAG
ncbi:MAG TPA: YceI family protein [Acidimicrobiales bacterium]|nr:YceI family protein [Acidimicrobiales bacterium]